MVLTLTDDTLEEARNYAEEERRRQREEEAQRQADTRSWGSPESVAALPVEGWNTSAGLDEIIRQQQAAAAPGVVVDPGSSSGWSYNGQPVPPDYQPDNNWGFPGQTWYAPEDPNAVEPANWSASPDYDAMNPLSTPVPEFTPVPTPYTPVPPYNPWADAGFEADVGVGTPEPGGWRKAIDMVPRPIRTGAGAAWDAFNTFESGVKETGLDILPPLATAGIRTIPGFNVAIPLVEALSPSAANLMRGNPGQVVESARQSGGNPWGFLQEQEEFFNQRPLQEQIAGEGFSPLNWIGTGAATKVLKGVEGTGKAAAFLRGAGRVNKALDVAQGKVLKPVIMPAVGAGTAFVANRAAGSPLEDWQALTGGAGAGALSIPAVKLGARGAKALGGELATGRLAGETGALDFRKVDLPIGAAHGPRNVAELAPLGTSRAEADIAAKEATTTRPGAIGNVVGKVPGVKRTAGIVNPSVTMEREPLVAFKAKGAAHAQIETEAFATRPAVVKQAEAAFKVAPTYHGPANNPIKGTILDIAQNPQDYAITPAQRAALDAIDARNRDLLNTIRSGYGADVGAFNPANPGAIYLPNINKVEDITDQVIANAESMRKPSIAKTRVWDTARDRALHDPNFKPETDLGVLLSVHDSQMGQLAGKETLKLGVGGKNRLEVMQEVHPALAKRMVALRQQVASLRGTAGRLDQRLADTVDSWLKDPDSMSLSDLESALDIKVGVNAVGKAGPNLGKTAAQLRGEVAKVRADIKALKPAWEAANTGPYVFNPSVFKYMTPEASNTTNELLRLSNGVFDRALKVADVSRATVLAGDFSPMTIQGALNVFRAPRVAGQTIFKMMREGGANLAEVAAKEPEQVRLYTQAKGRMLGHMAAESGAGAEFSGQPLFAHIPLLGKKMLATETKLFDAVQRFDYELWKSTKGLLQRINPKMTDEVASYEAANALSKGVPSLNAADRGVSAARGKVERGFITSTSFMASPVMMVKDATSALAKLAIGQKPRGREQIALIHAMTLAATIESAAIASQVWSAEREGISLEDAVKRAITPGTKYFAAFQIPGTSRWIPLGGPFRPFIQGVERTRTEGITGAGKFALSKLTPGFGTAVDLVRDKDYFDNPIRKGNTLEQAVRMVEYTLEGMFLPLAPGSIAEGVRLGKGIGDIAEDVGGQFMGSNVSRPTDWDEFNRKIRKDPAFGKDYADLNETQQDEAAAKYEMPEFKDKTPFNVSQAFDTYDAAKLAHETTLRGYIDQGINNKTLRKEVGDLKEKNWQASQDILGGAEVQALFKKNPDKVEDALRGAYWGAAVPETVDASGNIQLDFAARDADRAKVLEQARALGVPESYITDRSKYRFTDPKVQAEVERVEGVQKAIEDSGYFGLKDKAWATLTKNAPAAVKAFPDFYAWRDDAIEKMKPRIPSPPGVALDTAAAKAVADMGWSKSFSELMSEARTKWVMDHRNDGVAQTAWDWDYITPNEQQRDLMTSGKR